MSEWVPVALLQKYSPDEARDERGRWTDGGGGEIAGTSNVGAAFDAMGSEQFTQQGQQAANPQNYEPNRGSGVHLKIGATEWRQGADANGVPTIYQVQGVEASQANPADMLGLPMTAPDGQRVATVTVAGSEQPDPYVYRVVSTGEFAQAQQNGFFQSNQSMNLAAGEGTVASRVSTGSFYAPPNGSDYRVVQFHMDPNDGWRVDPRDGYVKTSSPIPASRIASYSQVIPGVAKGYNPDEPRDYHGRWGEGGGAAVTTTAAPSSMTATSTTRVMSPTPWMSPGGFISTLDGAHIPRMSSVYNTYNPALAGSGPQPGDILQYAMYAHFNADLAAGKIARGTTVMYDIENWSNTSQWEQAHPRQAAERFIATAHAAGLKVVLAPTRQMMDKVAGVHANQFLAQVQGLLDPAVLRAKIVELRAKMAPGCALVCELSANKANGRQMFAQWMAVRHLVGGFSLWGKPGDDLQRRRADNFFRLVDAQLARDRLGKDYNPDQPRDDHGRWTSAGGGGAASEKPFGYVDQSPDTTSKEWQNVTKAIRAQGKGNCYDAAVTLAMNATELGLKNPVIVQATVMGRGELEGQRFGHSWLEADAQSMDHPDAGAVTFRNAYDWSSGNSVVMPDALYRYLGQAQDVHEYTPDEAISEMARTGIYGPWNANTPLAGAKDWKNSGPAG